MFPVKAITLKGRLLVGLLKAFGKLLHLINGKKWQHPKSGFEENPATMTKGDIMYFGYKYYYKPHETAEHNSGLEEYFKNQDIDFTPPADFIIDKEITLSAGGDLMPYKVITKQSTKHLWDEVGDFYFGSDIVFANLETPIDLTRKPNAVPEVMLNDMLFNGSEELYHIYNGNGKYKGYHVLSTANNHSLDMGGQGIVNTLNFLDDKKVAHVGTARSVDEQDSSPIIERQGMKVAFLAYTYSMNKFLPIKGKEYMTNYIRLNQAEPDISLIINQAKKAKQRGADIIVCSLHMGNAYQAYPLQQTVDVFHEVFNKAGVDIILGGHPHNAQPMEKYSFTCPHTNISKNGFAIYSLADFVAYDIFTWCKMPIILKLKLAKGKQANKEHTIISGLDVMPIYNYGTINNGVFEMRFLPLMDDKVKNMNREAELLYEFARKVVNKSLSS